MSPTPTYGRRRVTDSFTPVDTVGVTSDTDTYTVADLTSTDVTLVTTNTEAEDMRSEVDVAGTPEEENVHGSPLPSIHRLPA